MTEKKTQDEDYQAAGFTGEVGFGRLPALLIVDPMLAYFDPASPMYAGVESIVGSNNRLIDAAKRKGFPVFVTRQVYDDPDPTNVYARKVRALQLLKPGSKLAEIVPTLKSAGARVLVKRYPSAFHKTNLAAQLASLRVDTLLLTGLTSSGCVRATAMDALLHNFHCVVIREAVGDRDAAQHAANLFDINAKLADVRGEAEVLAWIDRLDVAA